MASLSVDLDVAGVELLPRRLEVGSEPRLHGAALVLRLAQVALGGRARALVAVEDRKRHRKRGDERRVVRLGEAARTRARGEIGIAPCALQLDDRGTPFDLLVPAPELGVAFEPGADLREGWGRPHIGKVLRGRRERD